MPRRRQKKKNNARNPKKVSSSGEQKSEDNSAGTDHEKLILHLLKTGPLRDYEDDDLVELLSISILEEINEQAPFRLNNDDNDGGNGDSDGDGDGPPPITVVEDLTAMFVELIEGYVDDVDDLQEHWRVDLVDMAQDLVDEHPQLLLGTPKEGSSTIGAGDVCVALLEEDTTYHLALLVGEAGDDQWTVRFVDFHNLTRSVAKDLVKFTADLTEEARCEFGLTYVVEDGNDGNGNGKKGNETCKMCNRDIPITIHHLIPKSEHSRSDRARSYLNGPENALECCRPCHSNIHRVADNATLAKEYYTLELLMDHPKIAAFSTWVSSQPITQWERGAVNKLGRH